MKIFNSRFGYQLRRLHRENVLSGASVTRENRLKIGFVITECHKEATAGDFFTALELSEAFEKEIDCDIRFLPQRGPELADQFNAKGLDIVIVMIDRFDIRKLKAASPHLIRVGWMRNWFDRWSEWDWFDEYEYYWTSSEQARSYVFDKFSKPSLLVRIATNKSRFACEIDACERDIDVCFAGSYWNVHRDIEDCYEVLDKYNTHFYGYGWDKHPNISKFYKGALPYEKLPKIYSRTKIVVDDGAVSTKKWASINSRVFDAAASGCLVITNAGAGVQELISDCKIPSFTTPDELEQLLELYLNDPQLRNAKVKELQSAVLQKHTYDDRVKTICNEFPAIIENSLRFAIKVAAPRHSVKAEWGDYHFAMSLKKALEKLGHCVRVDIMCDWGCEESVGDDVNIVLRGLSKFDVDPDKINIMWNISHPDKIELDEYRQYDLVYVASNLAATELTVKLPNVDVKPLLQCTDTSRFYQDDDATVPEHELLFVGNSRNIYRDSVKFCIDEELDLAVYGTLWKQFVSENYLFGENIPNETLRKYYSRASVVLNDHWDTMRLQGFLSNRLYDAVASGAVVVSDRVEGFDEEYFGDSVVFYSGSDDFLKAVETAKRRVPDANAIKRVIMNDSFDARAQTISYDAMTAHKAKIELFD